MQPFKSYSGVLYFFVRGHTPVDDSTTRSQSKISTFVRSSSDVCDCASRMDGDRRQSWHRECAHCMHWPVSRTVVAYPTLFPFWLVSFSAEAEGWKVRDAAVAKLFPPENKTNKNKTNEKYRKGKPISATVPITFPRFHNFRCGVSFIMTTQPSTTDRFIDSIWTLPNNVIQCALTIDMGRKAKHNEYLLKMQSIWPSRPSANRGQHRAALCANCPPVVPSTQYWHVCAVQYSHLLYCFLFVLFGSFVLSGCICRGTNGGAPVPFYFSPVLILSALLLFSNFNLSRCVSNFVAVATVEPVVKRNIGHYAMGKCRTALAARTHTARLALAENNDVTHTHTAKHNRKSIESFRNAFDFKLFIGSITEQSRTKSTMYAGRPLSACTAR